VRSRISAPEWALLFGLAEGEAYADLAQAGGASAAALRVAATRLRAKLRPVLAGHPGSGSARPDSKGALA